VSFTSFASALFAESFPLRHQTLFWRTGMASPDSFDADRIRSLIETVPALER